MLRVLCCFAISLLLFSNQLFAQSEASIGLWVTSHFSEEDTAPASLKNRVLRVFKEEAEKLGIAVDGDQQGVLFFDAVDATVEGQSQIVLSVLYANELPKPVLDLGAEEEVFYMQFASDNLPEEGKDVRQYMSRDWLKQFVSPRAQEIRIFPEDDLQSEVHSLLLSYAGK